MKKQLKTLEFPLKIIIDSVPQSCSKQEAVQFLSESKGLEQMFNGLEVKEDKERACEYWEMMLERTAVEAMLQKHGEQFKGCVLNLRDCFNIEHEHEQEEEQEEKKEL